MGRLNRDDDTRYIAEATIEGPLFAGPDPFDSSPLERPQTEMERIVADLIFRHKGAANPISLAQIQTNTDLSDREVKGVVGDLRMRHRMPIGALRTSEEGRGGYFWIVDAKDREAAAAPYRAQILSMWKTLRLLDHPENLRELRDRMTVEAPADER